MLYLGIMRSAGAVCTPPDTGDPAGVMRERDRGVTDGSASDALEQRAIRRGHRQGDRQPRPFAAWAVAQNA